MGYSYGHGNVAIRIQDDDNIFQIKMNDNKPNGEFSTVKDLKNMFRVKGISKDHVKLFLENGEELEDTMWIKSLHDEFEVNILKWKIDFSSFPAGGKIKVKTLEGNIREFEYESLDSILSLKQQIEKDDKIYCPVENQRIIYAGRVLKDDKSFMSYGITPGRTVFLVVKQQMFDSGCPKPCKECDINNENKWKKMESKEVNSYDSNYSSWGGSMQIFVKC